MALQKQLLLGTVPAGINAGLTLATFSFVNNNDQVEAIFQVPDNLGAATMTITRLGYLESATTGVSPVMHISLQGVDASGNPDNVIKGAGNSAFATFTPSGSANWNWVTLGTPYVANRGDFLAWVIKYSSGTINASNRPIIANSLTSMNCVLPYAIGNVATVRTRVQSHPVFGFGTSTQAYGLPAQAITTTALVTPNERALRIWVDPLTCNTYQVIGVRMLLTTPAAGKTTNIVLYSGTTALQTAVWDSDAVAANGSARVVLAYFQDATLATLKSGVEYRISVVPQDALNNVALYQIDVAAAADLGAYPGSTDFYLSTRAGAAWTDVTTSRPVMELILGDITPPSPQLIIAT